MSLSRKNSRFSIFQLIRVLIFLIALYQISGATSVIDTALLFSTQGVIVPLSTSSLKWTGSSAGDFNGDGFEDIVIGLYSYSSSSVTSCGIVYVIFGTANGIPNIDLTTTTTLSPTQGIQITGTTNIGLGYSVAGLGDVNGDKIDDIIIGTATITYKVYVIFGKNNGQLSSIDLATTPDISTTNQGMTITFPYRAAAVSSAGDFNGDGINDFMVSFYAAVSFQGVAYVIFGKNGLSSLDLSTIPITTTQGFQILGTAASRLGTSLSKAGDVNGDGIDDIMVGTATSVGMVLIIYGTKTPTSPVQSGALLSNQGITITGSSSSIIGYLNSISCAGDLNNDGVDDIALGSPTYGASPTSFGMIYIIYGQKGGFSADIVLSPSSSSSWNGFQVKGKPYSNWSFGSSIASADINGDGLSDLIVGASKSANPAGSITGRTYVFFGNKNGFTDLDLANPAYQTPQVLTIYGKDVGDFFGSISRFANDLNKDGMNDFISIGQKNAFVFYGSTCGDLTQCDSPSLSPICYASQGCVCGEYNLYFQEKECISECSEGYYTNSAICESCPISCATCTSSSVCQTCNEGYTLTGTTCESIPQSLIDTATVLSNAKVAASIATLALTVLAFTNPGPIVIVSLSEVFLALRLMKINYPPRLKYMIENAQQKDTIFDQIMIPPDTLVDHMTNYPLPEKFEEVGFYSSFLVNFWPSLITIVGVLTLALLVIFISACIAPNKIKANTLTKKITVWLYTKLREAVKWNLLISTFIGCFGDMGMFTALELKTLHFNSVLEGLGFCICLLLNITGIFIQILLINVVWKLRKSHAQSRQKNSPDIFQNTKKKLEGYEVIFEVFKEDTFLQKSFLFIFNFKIYIFWAVISYFPDSPFASTLFNSIIGLFVLLYLVIVRPHKEKIEFASILIAEMLYEIMNICTFLLALDQTYGLNFGNSRIRLGDAIIVCNCIFTTLVLVFLAIQIFNLSKGSYSFIRELIKQKKNSDNNKNVTSLEQSSLNLSSIKNSADNSLHILQTSFGPEPNSSPFERILQKQTIKNQNLDDSEIAQIQPDNMDSINNPSPISKIMGMRVLWKTNNDIHEDRQKRQRDQDPVEGSNSKEKDQTFYPPARLIPAKILQIHGSERPNN